MKRPDIRSIPNNIWSDLNPEIGEYIVDGAPPDALAVDSVDTRTSSGDLKGIGHFLSWPGHSISLIGRITLLIRHFHLMPLLPENIN